VRQFVVSEAPVSRVTQHVREVVEEAGGIVAHHTSRKTEFDHLDYGSQAWRRAGYVGTYQRFQERPVQVRVRVWAQWPRRLLAGSIYLGFVVAILFFAVSILGLAIPPNVWIFTAAPLLALIAGSLLMYTSSMSDSEGAEQRIEAELVERLREDEEVPGEIYDVEDWETFRETVVEEAREDARDRVDQPSRIRQAAGGLASAIGSEETGDDEPAQASAAGEEPAEADREDEEGADEGRFGGVVAKLGLGGDEDDEAEADDGDDEDTEDEDAADEDASRADEASGQA
jgi:hypothetical protein